MTLVLIILTTLIVSVSVLVACIALLQVYDDYKNNQNK